MHPPKDLFLQICTKTKVLFCLKSLNMCVLNNKFKRLSVKTTNIKFMLHFFKKKLVFAAF